MREVSWLTTDVVNRASSISAKARAARTAAPGVPVPKNSIAPATIADGIAVVRLYDYIDAEGGYWGISSGEFAEALDEVKGVARIDLRINSGGGDVWDGLAILNTLRSHDAPVRGIVDGLAASAASFIAVACDELVMMPNSRLMIHDAISICIGQAADMRECADFLDDTSDNIAGIYAARAGGTTEEWRARMVDKGIQGEWLSAASAVEAGLADSIGGASGDTAADDDAAPSNRAATAAPPAPTAAAPPVDADETARARARAIAVRHRMKQRA